VAAELKEAFGVEAQLVESSGGMFDVIVDGKLVYSKAQTGRFPDEGEVVKLLEKAKGKKG
jgi:selenoprotein W-related protein